MSKTVTTIAGQNYSGIPENAIELSCKGVDPSECLGAWKDSDGVIYICGYHFGPSGDLLFKINADGSVE